MTIGRTNSGSGGLVLSKPLVHVIAQLGSTIEISYGGIVVKTIPPSKAFPNEDGINADYYYNASATGTYTITAIAGSMTESKTVSVTTVKQYNVKFSFLLLYDYGDEKIGVTGGWLFSKNAYDASLTKNADNMVLVVSRRSGLNASNGCVYTANAIDISNFSTAKYLYSFSALSSPVDPDQGSFLARTTPPTSGGYEGADPFTANLSIGTDLTGSCDISTATSAFYLALRSWVISSKGVETTLTIKRVWLE